MIEQTGVTTMWPTLAMTPPMAGDRTAGTPSQLQPTDSGAVGPNPASPGGAGQSPFGSIWLIFLVMIGMFGFMMLSQRKEKRKRENLLGSLRKNDRVQTMGGMLGRIVEIKGDEVVIKVDEQSNTRIRFARSAIQQVIKEAPAGTADTNETEAA